MSTPSVRDFEYEIGVRISRGDWVGASAAAAGCRAAWPADSAGWLLGSIAALHANQRDQALVLIEARLADEPGDVQCRLQYAECLLALGRRGEALLAIEAAADGAQTDPSALDALGEFLVHANEHRRALGVYDRAIELLPPATLEAAALRAKRGAVHRFVGNFALAVEDYEAVLAVSPNDVDALAQKAELRRQTVENNSIDALQATLATAAPQSKEAAVLHFGLAKSYEDLGEYGASWRHLSAGNRIERARLQYDAAQDQAVIERIMEEFSALEAVTADTTGERPIFILGLPRTGTTLVDRIIGSHSQVHCAGELSALSEAVGTVMQRTLRRKPSDWHEYAALLGRLDGAQIAAEYLANARTWRGERPRFTDKQPANFFYCALILRAFPNAQIVHLTRHPLAACYAIFKTRFGKTFPFSYDLAELAAFYVGYRRIMAHWHKVLPGRLIDVAYEDVVTRQEETTRRLLQRLDLPFEEACMEFHRNPTAVRTASSVQVRQPLYDSSIHQWRHFEAELAPLRARLEAAGIQVD